VWEVEALAQAVRALPTGQREAIELLKLKELSLKEASAVSGSTIGALKVASHRAMTALRRTLTRREDHED
jgi:RNA polymerase sigma-70 factor (ECF subfamily)